MTTPHKRLFISCVTKEFGSYRERLRCKLTRSNVEVKVQEDFIVTGTETLDMLDEYIQDCDAVVHLVGDMTGAQAQMPSLAKIQQRYHDLGNKLAPLAPFLQPGAPMLSYTQWEAWLALYHDKPLIIAVPHDKAPRDKHHAPIPEEHRVQQEHLQCLVSMDHHPYYFADANDLLVEILSSRLQEILAQTESPARADQDVLIKQPLTILGVVTTTLIGIMYVTKDWISGATINTTSILALLNLSFAVTFLLWIHKKDPKLVLYEGIYNCAEYLQLLDVKYKGKGTPLSKMDKEVQTAVRETAKDIQDHVNAVVRLRTHSLR